MPETEQYRYNLLLLATKQLVWFSALLRETFMVGIKETVTPVSGTILFLDLNWASWPHFSDW